MCAQGLGAPGYRTQIFESGWEPLSSSGETEAHRHVYTSPEDLPPSMVQADATVFMLPSPTSCPIDCRRGRFGPGCALRCDCGGGSDCDPISGQCRCVDGYTGPTCREGESGSEWGGLKTLLPWPDSYPSPQTSQREAWPSLPGTHSAHSSRR